MKHLAVAVSVVLLLSTPAFPDFYTWTDSTGTEHFTDDISRIPANYRKKATPMQGYDADSQVPPPVEEKAGQGAHGPEAARKSSGEALSAAEDGAGRTDGDMAERRQQALLADGSRAATLARMLLKDARTESEKAYALFNWIGTNITYDNSTKWQRRYGNSGADQDPEAVLASGRGVCEGIANLFTDVAVRMGLESAVVTGRASGARQERHAWNAVKIGGKWGLVDITRHTFLASPQEFLARHFPDDPRWQLMDKPLTYEEWLKR